MASLELSQRPHSRADPPASNNSAHAISQEEFDREESAYYEEYGPHLSKIVRNRLDPYRNDQGRFSCARFARVTLFGLFPFISIMRTFNPKRDLLKDVLAGFTVFVMAIPQGMAYGVLTGLGPVYGLYTSTFPIPIYFLLGTSRHLAIGVAAATCLMVNGAVSKFMSNLPDSVIPIRPSTTTPGSGGGVNITTSTRPITQGMMYLVDGELLTEQELKLKLNASLTLLIGIIQLLMGVFRLGFMTVFFSNAMVSAYTTGVAVHVLSSQVSYILGYKVANYNGPLKLYYFYRDLILDISKFNWIAFAISVFCIVLLLLTKEVLQPRLDKIKWYPKVPFPTDLILVITFTVMSSLINLQEKGVSIIGTIVQGIPRPITPFIPFWPTILIEAILLAILAYALAVSLATLFAAKHGYTIDSNQELLAFGLCNVAGTFMRTFVVTGSVGRSTVQNNAGGKTQLVSLVHFAGMMLLLLFIAPLFEPVPNCVLAAIIFVALKSMFWQALELPDLWRTSLTDFGVWVFTFTATILLDSDLGLICGFAVTLVTIVARSIFPHCSILARIPTRSLYVEAAIYPNAKEVPGIKIFRYEGALFFASFDYFRTKLSQKTGLDPLVLAKRQKLASKLSQSLPQQNGNTLSTVVDTDVDGPNTVGQHPSDHLSTSGQDENRMAHGKAMQNGTGHQSAELFECKSAYVRKTRTESTESKDNEGFDRDIPENPGERSGNSRGTNTNLSNGMERTAIHSIVLECTGWGYIDVTALKSLVELIRDYNAVGIAIRLTGCNATVRKMMFRSEYCSKITPIMYISIEEAIKAINR